MHTVQVILFTPFHMQ